uniref:protein-tyrosine-phosphatase n=1 Tax=Chromera velia CCMP2878 TaxID=1169474 RepID=A0A0G4GUT1_9ALVE|mmetsp:Transcript_44319/g.87487  ORF Transcript_44319/g.87487 Transcript_44319/m.87487 type:complete len:223 (-) Transcript_44319:282-950(-)|eukprot:Cvel_23464.t1-p1 / transcript=Cvel_23464.t1 / gene=Cvel_23464 / organism=Chromera_velia_CCMP2878 / gene_product=Dual specificity protein phosphatase, putative / transcript_product=Dual specificity protein phosphatase, putative / location=Cvel_scaffold2420:11350-12015(+) / protein_length=222 / sequence_SO=supercontig / SO=protein_coding / is_pseudo=false
MCCGTLSADLFPVFIAVGNGTLLVLLLFGVLGNHYFKVYSGLLNLVAEPVSVVCGRWAGVCVFVFFLVPSLLYTFLVIAVPSISVVLPNRVLLRNCTGAVRPDLLQQYKVTRILELHDGRRKNPEGKIPNVVHLQLECQDRLGSQSSLRQIAEDAHEFMDKSGVVLVHCSAGVSRSPALVVSWLVRRYHMTLEEAVRLMRRARPVVDISVDRLEGLILPDGT